MKYFPILFFICLFLYAGCKSNKEKSIEEILNLHFEAMGGTEALENTTNIYTKTISDGFEFTSYVHEGRQYRMDANNKTIIYNNGEGIVCENNKQKELENTGLWSAIENSFIFKLYRGKDRGWTFKLEDDPKTPAIEITGSNKVLNMYQTYSLMPDRWTIVKIENDLNQVIKYGKYQNFDGIMYPTEYEVWNGEAFIPCKIIEIQRNTTFADELFNLTCQNNEPMYRYSDINNNRFIISSNSISYDPIKPEESSSGTYSGGDAWKADITDENLKEIDRLIQAILANDKIKSEKRRMLTAVLSVKGEEEWNRLYVSRSEELNNLDNYLRSLKK